MERVKAEDPDYVIVLLTGEAGYNYAQQAADAGIGPMDMMFHANQAGLESKSWWENVPDGNLAFMARIGVPETMYNETALKFAEDYKAKTGKTGVESYALEAYDSIGVLAQALGTALAHERVDRAGCRLALHEVLLDVQALAGLGVGDVVHES